MNETDGLIIHCDSCNKKIHENEIYIYKGKRMCDDCAMKSGLFPLDHTGARRDKIAENGRRLTMPKAWDVSEK